jgi:DNA-directed RNA polymerase specialized sigma24 family protein
MDATHAKSPEMMNHYEGLVRTTASLCVPFVEEDFDDICQFLRYKVWKALESFDPCKLRVRVAGTQAIATARDKYVYSCVQNGKKDVLKKKRHGILFIEDLAPVDESDAKGGHHTLSRSFFEERYLVVENAFAHLEQELPTIPSTLSEAEKTVILLLYLDFKPPEIALRTGLTRKEITVVLKSIRGKMADWRPAGQEEAAAGLLRETLPAPLAA